MKGPAESGQSETEEETMMNAIKWAYYNKGVSDSLAKVLNAITLVNHDMVVDITDAIKALKVDV